MTADISSVWSKDGTDCIGIGAIPLVLQEFGKDGQGQPSNGTVDNIVQYNDLNHWFFPWGRPAHSFGCQAMHNDFVSQRQLEDRESKESRKLEVIDGRPIESRIIMTMVRLNIGTRSHQEQLPVFITKLGHYPIILGLSWYQLHSVTVKFQSQRIGFERSYFQQHCQHHSSIWVWDNHMAKTADLERPKLDICAVAMSPFMRRANKEILKAYTVTLYTINRVLGIKDV